MRSGKSEANSDRHGPSRTFDVLIVGGGSSGCAIAARLCRRTAASVCLIEAGPDYGPWAEGRWPADLLDPGCFPTSHDWGFTSVWKTGVEVPEALARVIGGGSSHNQCAAVWGHPTDYDSWAKAGNPGWSWDDLQEVARGIDETLQIRPHPQEQLAPWQWYFSESAIAAGYPQLPSAGVAAPIEGVGPWPATIRHGVRWNTAFAFLDPIRQRQGFTIVPETFAESLVLEGRRATGVRVRTRHGIEVLTARWIILCAGAVGSPVLLMRSGIGPAEELSALNIPVRYDLSGVGRNLHDHVGVWVVCSIRPEGPAVLREPPAWRSQVVLRARTPAEAPDRFDLHVLPYQWPSEDNREEYVLGIGACVMTPRSRGRVELPSPDPLVAPRIDFGYLTDLEGEDLRRLTHGLRVISTVAQTGSLATVVTLPPELERHPTNYILEHVGGYAHPVGTCRMGPASDPAAVVNARGRVNGLENAFVADASIMPVIPRANTNLTCMLIGTRIGDLLVEDTGLT